MAWACPLAAMHLQTQYIVTANVRDERIGSVGFFLRGFAMQHLTQMQGGVGTVIVHRHEQL